MTNETHAVTLYVQVTDPQALHAHAMAQATGADGMQREDALGMLGASDDPDISACLRCVFDPGQSPPGTSILDSSCE